MMGTVTSRATGGFGRAVLSVPPGQGWPPPGQGWPPPNQTPQPGPPPGGWPPPQMPPSQRPSSQTPQGPSPRRQQYPPQQPQWVPHRLRDVKPPTPGLLTGIRLLVMVPTGIWLLGLLSLVLLGGASSDSVLGPVLETFSLGLAAGDWAPMVLIPLGGCVLTVTMGAGHQIDRILFTAAGALWAIWFTWSVHFALTPPWLTIMLVVVAVSCAWNPTYNRWVRAVEQYELRLLQPQTPAGQDGVAR